MKFVWVIAIILAILFGESVGLGFWAICFLGTFVLLTLAAIYMAIVQMKDMKLGSALCWLGVAIFFGMLLRIFF